MCVIAWYNYVLLCLQLRAALAESGKNSSLLAEYHDLYELQRNRLEKNVKILSDEKEIWSTAAYSLALKVSDATAAYSLALKVSDVTAAYSLALKVSDVTAAIWVAVSVS